MIQLRDYQQRTIDDLRAAYAAGRRAPVAVLPTGAGKTVIAAEIMRNAVERGTRTLFLAHRAELLSQTVHKLSAVGIDGVRVIRAANDLGDPNAPIVVASIPTLVGRDQLPEADLVVFDECHHAVAQSWRRIADHYASARLLGLTATPERSDGKPLGDLFDALIVGPSIRQLTELGHLVPCEVYAPPGKLETGEIAVNIVAAYRRHADGLRAVVFCGTVAVAEQYVDELRDAGVAAAVVSGKRSRSDTMAAFARGELRVICNVHVLTEGWDDPGVEAIILARKPGHVGTYLQIAGRGLRPATGKTRALLIDLCGAVHEHGTPDADREYSLDGRAISSTDDREPIRQCPTCGAVFRAVEVEAGCCPKCGVELPRKPVEAPTAIGAELQAIGSKAAPAPSRTFTIAARFESWCAVCRAPIHVGDSIAWARGAKPKHTRCADRAAMNAADALLRSA